jgi:hypothetical protein
MHTAQEIGVDDFQANRSPDKRYRTSPLRGLFSHERAASITMDGLPRWPMWFSTTTAFSG